MAHEISRIVPAERVLNVEDADLIGVDLKLHVYGVARAIVAYPLVDSGSDWTTALNVTIRPDNNPSNVVHPMLPGSIYPIAVREVVDVGTAAIVLLYW